MDTGEADARIVEERARQDDRWGGAHHDDTVLRRGDGGQLYTLLA